MHRANCRTYLRSRTFKIVKGIEENLKRLMENDGQLDKMEKFLELAGNALLSYQMGIPEEKREMLKIVTSNRQVQDKKLYLRPSIPFQAIANRFENAGCSPTGNRILRIRYRLRIFSP